MVKEKKEDEVLDFYKIIPKSLLPKYDNPNYKVHGINIPARILCIGNSGCRKTAWLMDLIHKFNDTFGNISLICQDKNEPLYTYLRSQIDDDQLQIYEGLDNTPSMATLDPECQHLVIWDDCCLEKRQTIVDDYFIRSRKIAKGVSCIYISQSYFKIAKTTRLQATHIVLKKLSCIRDLKVVLSDFNLGLNPEQLLKLYQYCTKDTNNFLMIDMTAQPEQRFRLNYSHIIDINNLIE